MASTRRSFRPRPAPDAGASPEGDGDLFATATAARVTLRNGEHSGAREANADVDPAEIWGRRVGRGLGVLAVAMLGFYLAVTYLF